MVNGYYDRMVLRFKITLTTMIVKVKRRLVRRIVDNFVKQQMSFCVLEINFLTLPDAIYKLASQYEL